MISDQFNLSVNQFLTNAKIQDKIPKQIFKGMDLCRVEGIDLVANNDIKFQTAQTRAGQ